MFKTWWKILKILYFEEFINRGCTAAVQLAVCNKNRTGGPASVQPNRQLNALIYTHWKWILEQGRSSGTHVEARASLSLAFPARMSLLVVFWPPKRSAKYHTSCTSRDSSCIDWNGFYSTERSTCFGWKVIKEGPLSIDSVDQTCAPFVTSLTEEEADTSTHYSVLMIHGSEL